MPTPVMEVDRELNNLSEVSEDAHERELSPCIGGAVTESCEDIA